MESKYSLAQGGNLVVIAGFLVMIARHYRLDIAENEVVAVLGGLVTVVGVVMSWIGRYRAGGITLGGFRK